MAGFYVCRHCGQRRAITDVCWCKFIAPEVVRFLYGDGFSEQIPRGLMADTMPDHRADFDSGLTDYDRHFLKQLRIQP